jgi:hypothetical protein
MTAGYPLVPVGGERIVAIEKFLSVLWEIDWLKPQFLPIGILDCIDELSETNVRTEVYPHSRNNFSYVLTQTNSFS